MRRALPDAAAAVGTLLVAASAWLFWPRERSGDSPTLPPLRIVLVDTSASAVWRHKDWSDRTRKILSHQRETAQRSGEDLAVILFGWDVQRIFGPAAADGFDEAGELPRPFRKEPNRGEWLAAEEATRVADGLEVAREIVEGQARPASRVVLVGDGTYTGTDPRRALALLANAGVHLERVDVLPDVEEAVPGDLNLPEEVEVGAPIAASFDVFYAPGTTARKSHVTLYRDRRPFDVPVPAGLVPDEDGYLRWHVRTETGLARAGWNPVRISGRRDSPGATDRDFGVSSSGVVRGAGARLVALVAQGHPLTFGDRPVPSLSVSGSGLEAVWIWPQELAAEIERFDAVVTFDLPLGDLPIPILRSFVERGGGWLALVGEDSLSSFVTGTAPDFLPLLPPEDEPEPRDVIFLVDRSGSMSEDRTENVRRAVFALMDEALPSDTVELRWFSDRLSPPIHLIGPEDSKRPADREEARRLAADRLFATEVGGGPTALLRSLGELAESRSRVGRDSLVFLLTDGRDNTDPDPVVSAPLVLDRLRAARAELVVIAAGVQADRGLLSRLVGPDQELAEVTSLLDSSSSTQLRVLFWRELNRERVRRGDHLRILPTESPSGLAAEVLPAMKPELAHEWPTLQEYVRAKAAAGADSLWISQTGEPLLAVQRVGFGSSAACAFSLGGQRFLADDRLPAFGELLAPLLRMLARGTRSDRPIAHVEGDDLVVQGLPTDAPADLEARVFGSYAEAGDPPAAVISVAPPVEGGDPRRVRRGRWPSSTTDALSKLWDEHDLGLRKLNYGSARTPRIEIRSEATSWTPIHLALAPPRAVEFVLPRPRIPPFESITIGRSRAGDSRPQPHPSAPWVLLSGLLLLAGAGFAGSFSRRVR